MKKILLCCFAIFAFALFSEGKIEENVPAGFAWKNLPFINGAILKPLDWFFHHLEVPDEKRYMFMIARENYESGAKVKTILNIIVICDIPGKKNMTASEYAKQHIDKIALQTKLHKREKKDYGQFVREEFFRVDKANNFSGTIKEYFTTLANNKTGTIYMFSFVSPIENWEKDFPIAETMINNIRLDDNF